MFCSLGYRLCSRVALGVGIVISNHVFGFESLVIMISNHVFGFESLVIMISNHVFGFESLVIMISNHVFGFGFGSRKGFGHSLD